jgi:hypothetical protein
MKINCHIQLNAYPNVPKHEIMGKLAKDIAQQILQHELMELSGYYDANTHAMTYVGSCEVYPLKERNFNKTSKITKEMTKKEICKYYVELLDKFKFPEDENYIDCYEALRTAQGNLLYGNSVEIEIKKQPRCGEASWACGDCMGDDNCKETCKSCKLYYRRD